MTGICRGHTTLKTDLRKLMQTGELNQEPVETGAVTLARVTGEATLLDLRHQKEADQAEAREEGEVEEGTLEKAEGGEVDVTTVDRKGILQGSVLISPHALLSSASNATKRATCHEIALTPTLLLLVDPEMTRAAKGQSPGDRRKQLGLGELQTQLGE
jgi:hypothetical protein